MIYLIGFMVVLLGILIINLCNKMATSFELVFNKLHIDTDIWGSDKDVWYSNGFYGRYGRFNNTYYNNLYFIWLNG